MNIPRKRNILQIGRLRFIITFFATGPSITFEGLKVRYNLPNTPKKLVLFHYLNAQTCESVTRVSRSGLLL